MQISIQFFVLFLFLVCSASLSAEGISANSSISSSSEAVIDIPVIELKFNSIVKPAKFVAKKKRLEKVIVVDPRKHIWRAYSSDGKLVRSGVATTGARWCPDVGRPCKTKTGVFRVYSLGSHSCFSKKYPLPRGGAPMPYCMYFNGGQGIHGSYQVVRANASHGCVRVRVSDAKWLRFNFVNVGTKIVVKSY